MIKTIDQLKDYFFKSIVVNENGCWIWQKGKDKDGYGLTKIEKPSKRAHRLSYTVFKGVIPKGLWVLHHCDCPSCINPAHLFLGTAKDNKLDCISKDRHAHGEKHYYTKLNEHKIKEIVALYKEGFSSGEIAKVYSISCSTILKLLHKTSWKHLKINFSEKEIRSQACGENHGANKLTNENVLEIRKLYKYGIKIKKIAKKFNVAYPTVSDIINNKCWKHI